MSDHTISSQEAISLLLKNSTLLDVRAEQEFIHGSFPSSYNLPILNDLEREAVGIRYKSQGQESAIALGHELVNEEIKAARCKGWIELIDQHQMKALFCWRGGLRSKLAAQWLAETGHLIPRIAGGYKAIRTTLLMALESLPQELTLLLIGGRTGSGKTELLQKISGHIDLEGLAQHQGSAFGAYPWPQTTPANFQNLLALEMLKHDRCQPLILEDEGGFIGQLQLPLKLYQAMQKSNLMLIERPLKERVELIFENYIIQRYENYQSYYAEDAQAAFFEWLQNALKKIQKRLGGLRYQELSQGMNKAISDQRKTSQFDAHRKWISGLLSVYYDPMYDYQLKQKSDRVVFVGDEKAILHYRSQATQSTSS